MSKVELKIVDPKLLEGGTNEPPVQMTYGDTDSSVVIDTETAFIECEAQNKSAVIRQWVVDFANHKMKLSDDSPDGNYREIDYVTAMGMVGQLVMEVGQRTLQTLLTTLANVMRDADEPKPEPSHVDAPVEGAPESPNVPESPKEPIVPDPINLDV